MLFLNIKQIAKIRKLRARGEEWFDGIKDEYPYQETLPKTFEKGESKYENPFFAGTYNAKDQDTTGGMIDTAFSACLWEEVCKFKRHITDQIKDMSFYQDYCIGINTHHLL